MSPIQQSVPFLTRATAIVCIWEENSIKQIIFLWKSYSSKQKKEGDTRWGHQLLTNPSDDRALHNRPVNLYQCDHRAWDLMHAGISCDIPSQWSWGGRNTCSEGVCTYMWGGWGTNRDLFTSSLSKWHHRRELRLHSCLMAGDIEAHAWTHRSSKRMRRSLLPLLVRRKNNGSPPQVHTCTPGMSRMRGDGDEEGGNRNPFGFMHLSQEA